MKTLSPRQLALVGAVANTLFSVGGREIPAARLAFTLHGVHDTLARAGFQTRLAFRAALWVVQLSPLLLGVALGRFARLPLPTRGKCLARLERSRLGLVLVLLKTVLCLHYFEHPAVLARTGYDGEGLHGPAWAADGVSPLGHKLPVVVDEPAVEHG